MKRLVILLILVSLPPIACSIGPTPDIDATVQVAVAATLTAQNAEAPAPTVTQPPETPTLAPAFTPLAPTPTPTPTPIPPTPTPVVPTLTDTDTPVPPTASRTPAPPTATPPTALPSYSEVVNAYPANADMCKTEADLVGEDGDSFQFKGSLSIRGGQFVYQCYGTKITVQVEVTLDGTSYAPGTKLTVDKDLEWIEVSGWD
jgi:hypothetical protein